MEEDLKNAVKTLKEGGVILYPTDTIWGIGCDATNPEAVDRIFKIKQRDDAKAMLVLVDNEAKIQRLVSDVPPIAWDLIEMSETPLTIIYSGAKNLAPNLIAEDGSVGIRVTKETFSKKLCERFGRPVVSTSANISGSPSPLSFGEINKEIIALVDYVVAYRQQEKKQAAPSSIIKLEEGGVFSILRK